MDFISFVFIVRLLIVAFLMAAILFREFFENDRIFVRRLLEQPLFLTIRTHYRILREKGLKQYFLYSFYYRRRQLMDRIKKTI